MEFLRKLIVQTQSHLKGLSLSQRLAIGSCVALIVAAMLLLVNWAQEPDYIALLDQPMSQDELTAIQADLDSQGVKYQLVGDRIMVPAGDQYRLKGRLAERQLLPSDTSIGFSKIIEENNAFLSADQQNRRWTLALSNELARTLGNFSWIDSARVFINDTHKRRVGGPSLQPSASVNIKLKSGQQMDEERVRAIAALVAGPVPGLELSEVQIVDSTGRAHHVRKNADGLAYDDLSVRQKKEQYFKDNIAELLDYIPGVRIRVHADLDPESRIENSMSYGEPFPMTKETESEIRDEGAAPSEPGVVPNTAQNISVAGVEKKYEKEHSVVNFKGEVDYTQTRIERARFGINRLFASVFVPRSYLVAIYQKSNDGKEPTDEELDAANSTRKVLDDIHKKVLCALGAEEGDSSKGVVEVGWCYDGATALFEETMAAGMDQGMMEYLQAYGGKAGLGLLAVMSLVMMMMMVRKVGEGPILPGEEPPQSKIITIKGRKGRGVEEEEFALAGEPVGEVAESEPLMMGKEVDESTLQTQRVVEQIAELVKEDPQISANILQRWIDADK